MKCIISSVYHLLSYLEKGYHVITLCELHWWNIFVTVPYLMEICSLASILAPTLWVSSLLKWSWLHHFWVFEGPSKSDWIWTCYCFPNYGTCNAKLNVLGQQKGNLFCTIINIQFRVIERLEWYCLNLY